MPRGGGVAINGSAKLSAAGLIALAITVIALAITAASAHAATTRAEWVAQVDPICQVGIEQEGAAGRPVVKKLRRLEKHAKSRKARRRALRKEARLLARFYSLVATIEQSVNAQIAAIPPAIEDTSLVKVWLRIRGEEVEAFRRMFRAFSRGNDFAAFFLLLDVEAKSEEANDLVRDFGFKYCTSYAQQVGL